MFKESRAAQSAAGQEIGRLRRRKKKSYYEKYDVALMSEQKLMLFFWEWDKPGVPRIQDNRRSANNSRITQRSYAIRTISSATESHHRSWGKDKKKPRFLVFKEIWNQRRTLWTTGMITVLEHRHHQKGEGRKQQSVTYHELVMTLSWFNLESTRCRKSYDFFTDWKSQNKTVILCNIPEPLCKKIGDVEDAKSRESDVSKVQRENNNIQAFDTQWDEALSAVTDRPTDNKLESPYKMQVERSEEFEIGVASLCSRDDIRRKEIRLLQIEVDGPKTSRAVNQGFPFQKREIQTKTDLQQGLREKEREHTPCVGPQKNNVQLMNHAHSSMNHSRYSQFADSLVMKRALKWMPIITSIFLWDTRPSWWRSMSAGFPSLKDSYLSGFLHPRYLSFP